MERDMCFAIKDYQKQKPFSSFLSGIAGTSGIPLWSYYVNRGQLIAGFGIRDKNGAIMEFFPANAAYHYVSRIGFRTFLKVRGKVVELFRETNPGQTLLVRPDRVTIEEDNAETGIRVRVTYFTLPGENLAALVRKVELENRSEKPLDVEIVDGLAQILPAGIDYGGYKAISNLLQSWMSSYPEEGYLFYKLRASTADSSEVAEVADGNFFACSAPVKPLLVSDYKLLFGEDTSLETPYGFMEHPVSGLGEIPQTRVNQVPCAMSALPFPGLKTAAFVSFFGYAPDKNLLSGFVRRADPAYAEAKEKENESLHRDLMSSAETKTAFPLLDDWFRQCQLDNVLRGGKPLLIETLEGTVGYPVYSRKHGDLERDYNFFSLEPAFYSQGNGAFRDVLQNRRNDIFFEPRIGDFEIAHFASLLQADGYNPLGIEGIRFAFEGDPSSFPSVLKPLAEKTFTPGEAATALRRAGLPEEPLLSRFLSQSRPRIRATYGEGYWEDHFTYFLDLVESFLAVWPDREENLLFERLHPYFRSPVAVRPRSEKTVIRKDGKIRQYGALRHLEGMKDGWLENGSGPLEANLFGKLLTVALNKFGHLDPEGIGLSYEADRPGWNDAMNGLPGLFGSGIPEAVELLRIVRFLRKESALFPEKPVRMLKSTADFGEKLASLPVPRSAFEAWDARMTALETYRKRLLAEIPESGNTPACSWIPLLSRMESVLGEGILRARKLGPVPPTYLVYEALGHEPLLAPDESPLVGDYGLPLARVTSFAMKPLPPFLEAPARILSSRIPEAEARELYESVRNSGLFDSRFGFYQTSVSLEDWTMEIGRIRAFTPGWLERESNFLHMTFKYLLGLLKSGLYDEFYAEMPKNLPCFMDPSIYGRSPLENCSFLATSANPDPKKRGQGFVARLSGSTAEALSMRQILFFGETPFRMEGGVLAFAPSPKLHVSLFDHGVAEARLFGRTTVRYHLESPVNTYDPGVGIARMTLENDEGVREFAGSRVLGTSAQDIRAGKVFLINVYFKFFPKEGKQ